MYIFNYTHFFVVFNNSLYNVDIHSTINIIADVQFLYYNLRNLFLKLCFFHYFLRVLQNMNTTISLQDVHVLSKFKWLKMGCSKVYPCNKKFHYGMIYVPYGDFIEFGCKASMFFVVGKFH